LVIFKDENGDAKIIKNRFDINFNQYQKSQYWKMARVSQEFEYRKYK